jgi:anti-sigma regulatory factor (Ser/Thr protein kinase)
MSPTRFPRSGYAECEDGKRRSLPGPFGSACGWRHRSFLELGALPSGVPCARLHARQVTWEWGLAALRQDIELLVSELVTNAILASGVLGQGTAVRLWLLSDGTQVLIMVWDAKKQPPVRLDSGPDAESGRGLLLVEALSHQWSWYPTTEPSGKVVWALLARR